MKTTYLQVETIEGLFTILSNDHGVTRILFPTQDAKKVIAEQKASLDNNLNAILAAEELSSYLHTGTPSFTFRTDETVLSPIQRKTFAKLKESRIGQTMSYGELATEAGLGKAARAVGTALASNPLPFIIPCHRVIRSDGKAGNYLGGEKLKKKLLVMELSKANQ